MISVPPSLNQKKPGEKENFKGGAREKEPTMHPKWQNNGKRGCPEETELGAQPRPFTKEKRFYKLRLVSAEQRETRLQQLRKHVSHQRAAESDQQKLQQMSNRQHEWIAAEMIEERQNWLHRFSQRWHIVLNCALLKAANVFHIKVILVGKLRLAPNQVLHVTSIMNY